MPVILACDTPPPVPLDVVVDPNPEMLTHWTPRDDAILLYRIPVEGLYHSSPTVTPMGSVVETKCWRLTLDDILCLCFRPRDSSENRVSRNTRHVSRSNRNDIRTIWIKIIKSSWTCE